MTGVISSGYQERRTAKSALAINLGQSILSSEHFFCTEARAPTPGSPHLIQFMQFDIKAKGQWLRANG
jgi:hypothetical protein